MQPCWARQISFSKKNINSADYYALHYFALHWLRYKCFWFIDCVSQKAYLFMNLDRRGNQNMIHSVRWLHCHRLPQLHNSGTELSCVILSHLTGEHWKLSILLGSLKRFLLFQSSLPVTSVWQHVTKHTQPFQALQVNMGIFPFNWRALQLTSFAVFVDTLTLLPLSIQAICPVKYHVVQYDIGSISATRLAFIFMVAPIWRPTAI